METQQTVSPPAPIAPRPSTLLYLGVAVFLLVLVGYGTLMVLGSTREAQRNEFDSKITELEKQLREKDVATAQKHYNALDTVVSQLAGVQNERFLFEPVWKDIKASVPKDMQFLNVTMGTDSTFRISGVTRSVTSVSYFTKALSSKPGMSSVVPVSIDKNITGDTFSFTVSFKYQPVKTSGGQ